MDEALSACARAVSGALSQLDAQNPATAKFLGATIVELDGLAGPDPQDVATIMLSEIGTHHTPYSDRSLRYRPMVLKQLEDAAGQTSVREYIEAQERRAGLTMAWEQWFLDHRIDAIIEPPLILTAHERDKGYDRASVGRA